MRRDRQHTGRTCREFQMKEAMRWNHQYQFFKFTTKNGTLLSSYTAYVYKRQNGKSITQWSFTEIGYFFVLNRNPQVCPNKVMVCILFGPAMGLPQPPTSSFNHNIIKTPNQSYCLQVAVSCCRNTVSLPASGLPSAQRVFKSLQMRERHRQEKKIRYSSLTSEHNGKSLN